MIISDNNNNNNSNKYKIVYPQPCPSINRCNNSISNLRSPSNTLRVSLLNSPSLRSSNIDTLCPNKSRGSSSSSLNHSGKMLLPSRSAQTPGVTTSYMQYATCASSKQLLGLPRRPARPLLLLLLVRLGRLQGR